MTYYYKSTSTLILEFIKRNFLGSKYKLQLVPVRAKTTNHDALLKKQSNQ